MRMILVYIFSSCATLVRPVPLRLSTKPKYETEAPPSTKLSTYLTVEYEYYFKKSFAHGAHCSIKPTSLSSTFLTFNCVKSKSFFNFLGQIDPNWDRLYPIWDFFKGLQPDWPLRGRMAEVWEDFLRPSQAGAGWPQKF